ncbi:FAD-dependent oxidoreductase [Natronococcus sp. A-GB1]|uniref:NAD(P)/FAD-dependent oxidoreductase n=1 Tax=Natronococcus sp. A-GB1 TaxID=3037648 RepID=UPI00241C800E|nr:FAD-dependent oxidoreductase [Natronococcus sp. A-GB1]MDG5759991.1 FAD-dependent oxidoreductase [Natronococcus sp. A-GB1]
MKRIGIVGAGVGAAGAAFALEESTDDVSVTVLEKSGGLCGRAATRRRDDVVYDYGANYLKAGDERVVELVTETLPTEGLVDIDEPVWTFDRGGAIEPGRDADDHKWTYRRGLTQLAKRLFARTDAMIHRETRVERLVRDEDAGTWTLEDAAGNPWGPYDVVLLNPPAPQTAALLESSVWESDRRESLLEAIAEVSYRRVWTGVFRYPFELDVPYYALVNTDKDHEIGWVSREECKPDHVPDGDSLLIVQANHEWSVDHYDRDPERNLAELAALTAGLLEDDRLTEPEWTDHQGWRYAIPEGGVSSDSLERAESEGLYCVGDWTAGEGRIHAALRNGLEVGERIAERRWD